MSGDKAKWSPEARKAAALRAADRTLNHSKVLAVQRKRRQVQVKADEMSEVLVAFQIAKSRHHDGHRLLYDLVASGPWHGFQCVTCGGEVYVSRMEACAGGSEP